MTRKKWLPHILLGLFDLLILLSVWLSYADSHGLLSAAAITDGTFSNGLISMIYCASVLLAVVPYGCGVVVSSLMGYWKARKEATQDRKLRLTLLLAAFPAWLLTLGVKALLLLFLVSEILFPDSFHI